MKKILVTILQTDGILRYEEIESNNVHFASLALKKLQRGEIVVGVIYTDYSLELAKKLHEINIKRYHYKK